MSFAFPIDRNSSFPLPRPSVTRNSRERKREDRVCLYVYMYLYTGSPLLLFFFFTNNTRSLFRNTTLLTLFSFVRLVERRKMKKIRLEKILQHRCFLLLFLYKSLKQSTFRLQRFHPPRSFLSIAFLFIPIFISRAEQMKRLFDASLQPGVPSAWFPVGLINTSRIVLRALD